MNTINPNPDEQLKNIERQINLSIFIAIILIASVLIAYFLKFNKGFSVSNGDWGTFGDFVGGTLNPLLAALAFYWLTSSIRLQLQELRETRNVLKETSDHQEKIAELEEKNVSTQQEILDLQTQSLSKQIIAAEQQQKQIAIQNFESLFFQLLRTKDDALNDIIHIKYTQSINPKNKDGQAETIIETCKSVDAIKMHIIDFKSQTTEDWLTYYEKNMLDFTGSYFRICYQIVKLIDQNENLKDINASSNNKHPTQEQKKYFDIFRATLTKHETEAFFFNCLNEYGNKKFKKLIEKYGLFEPLPIDLNRTGEQIHRLTKYAYQFNPIIFEENKSWINYYNDLKEININIDTHKMIEIFKKLLELEVIKHSKLHSTLRVEKNNPILSGTSYYLNIVEKYDDISHLVSDENITQIKDTYNSTYSKNRRGENQSISNIKTYRDYMDRIEAQFIENNEPYDRYKKIVVDEFQDISYSIEILESFIQEENTKQTIFAGYFSNYSLDKQAIQNSEYTVTALLLVKYGIDYTDYCNYMSNFEKTSDPE